MGLGQNTEGEEGQGFLVRAWSAAEARGLWQVHREAAEWGSVSHPRERDSAR